MLPPPSKFYTDMMKKVPFPQAIFSSAAKNRNSCIQERHCRSLVPFPPPSVSNQQRSTKLLLPAAGIRLLPRLATLATPWPWQQRCGNSSASLWKYLHLNQCISGSAAHSSAAKNRSWKKSRREYRSVKQAEWEKGIQSESRLKASADKTRFVPTGMVKQETEKLGFNLSTPKMKAAGFFDTSASIYRITVP